MRSFCPFACFFADLEPLKKKVLPETDCQAQFLKATIHPADFPVTHRKSEEQTFNGNFRILKWRYVSTIFLAIFCGDIP